MTTITKSKPKRMTWTQVKKHIQNFSQPALLDLIHQMYNASDLNKAFLTARFQPEATLGSPELAALKKRIYKYMCPKPNHSYDEYSLNPKYGPARKLITDYKKTKDTLGTLDLMLVYVEAGNEFTCTYGDIDGPFYDSLCAMLSSFAKLFSSSDEDPMPYFQDRLKKLAQSASGMGWGYGDYVNDTVDQLGVWD